MPRGKPPNPSRSFGLSVGAVLCLLAMMVAARGAVGRAGVLGTVAAALVILGLAYPRALEWPTATWGRFAHALAYINARIILIGLFGLVLVPLSIMWRVTGHDPLGRNSDRRVGWTSWPARYRDRNHYRHMF